MYNCKTCIHSKLQAVNPNNIGVTPPLECRRFPPQLIVIPMQTGGGTAFAPASAFPIVSNDQHCYEFQAANS